MRNAADRRSNPLGAGTLAAISSWFVNRQIDAMRAEGARNEQSLTVVLRSGEQIDCVYWGMALADGRTASAVKKADVVRLFSLRQQRTNVAGNCDTCRSLHGKIGVECARGGHTRFTYQTVCLVRCCSRDILSLYRPDLRPRREVCEHVE